MATTTTQYADPLDPPGALAVLIAAVQGETIRRGSGGLARSGAMTGTRDGP